MSFLAWLDHDEAERRRMLEVIELFRERDTVDELGIGSVRDAFSNLEDLIAFLARSLSEEEIGRISEALRIDLAPRAKTLERGVLR